MSSALYQLGAPTTLRGLITAAETNPAIAGIVNIFGGSAESAALYGSGTTRQFVTAIYEHLLGRAPDAEGLAFWSDNIDNGTFSRSMGAFQIMAGANENTTAQGLLDAKLLANRLDAASNFTSRTYDTYYFEYTGDSAAALARKVLDGISANTTSTAYQAQISSLITNLTASPHNVTLSSDTGTSATDRITSQDKGLQITGKVGQGVVVELYVDGATTAATRSQPATNGSFLITTDLNEGKHSLVLKPLNASNLANSSLDVTIDKTAPSAPTVPVEVAANADGGINASEFDYQNSPKIVVDIRELNAVVGQKIELLMDGRPYFPSNWTNGLLTLTAQDIARGNVTFAISYNYSAQGSHVVSTRVYDVAGNVSASGGGTSILIDTISPAAPQLTIINTYGDIVSAAELAKGLNAKVALTSADAIAGNLVRMSLGFGGKAPDRVIDTVLTASAVKSGYLTYAFNAADLISDGVVTLTSTLRDAVGNWSYSYGSTVTIDSTPPGAPSNALSIAALADGTLRPSERSAGVQVEIDLTGTGAGYGDTIELLANGKSFTNPVTTTIWDYGTTKNKATLAISSYAGWPLTDSVMLSARVIDKAGNVGLAGPELKALLGTYDLTLDYNAVTIPSNESNGVNAAEKAAGIGVNVSLANSHAVAGDTVSLSVNGVPFASPIKHTITAAEISANIVRLSIAGSQNWGNGDGNYTLRTTLADSVGNSSVRDKYVTIDTTAPGLLGVPATKVGPVSTANGVRLDFDIAGSGGKGGDTVEVIINGKVVKSSWTSWGDYYSPSTTVQVSLASNLDEWKTDGLKNVMARVVDQAGNIGPASASFTLQVDNTGPRLDPKSPPVYTDVNHNGKIDAGDTYLLTFDDKLLASTRSPSITIQSGPYWSMLDSTTQFTVAADGLHGTLVLGTNNNYGTSTTFASGDIITLTGFQDPVGNWGMATFTL